MAKPTCAVDGCDRSVERRQWCYRHYLRWWKHGDPEYVARPTVEICQIEGCTAAPRSRSNHYCEKHYMRLRRRGTVDLILPGWDEPIRENCDYCSEKITGQPVSRRWCSPRCQTRAARSVPLDPGQCITCDSPLPMGSRQDRRYCSRACEGQLRGHHRQRMIRKLVARDGATCALCGEVVDTTTQWPDPWSPTTDHVIPRSLGGTNDLPNLQLAHSTCNSRKGNGYLPSGEQLRLM